MDGSFSFAGVTRRVDRTTWTSAGPFPLWTYNVQYFDYAVDLAWVWCIDGDARAGACLEALILEWIDATRGRAGRGWEPYPTSMRLVNWCDVLALVGEKLGATMRDAMIASLREQHAVLERDVEWHLLGNHVQKNLHALVVAGVMLGHDRTRPARWRATLDALREQWTEQVLADGTHFERSPMYHALAVQDLVECIGVLAATNAADTAWERRLAERMMVAATRFERPDGSWSLFNDSANGIAPTPAELRELAHAAGVAISLPNDGSWALPAAGYYGNRDVARGESILIDCGEPGPRYQPGHAHCDMLSFEYDAGGRPIVIDAGVRGYDGDTLREYVRSTRAHNTVSIGGREQSELWGVFRVARRASVGAAQVDVSSSAWRFRGSARPFHGHGVHHRDVRWSTGRLEVRDRVTGADDESIASFIHLHPRFDAQLDDDGRIAAHAAEERIVVEVFGDGVEVQLARGETDPSQGWYCPEFGVAVPCVAIVLRIARNRGNEFGYAITIG